ncbi:hypothetical protein [Ruegeria sp. HKCCD6119]|uniref:hypothetical protein n=1 Tax=Ruegeria sp. HKCCD6119 TaxID=2683003 RepID=UPI0014923FAC|nr:hypothetical protein [Ruegeria sp. HKCCD6119]NOD85183.1 hypothetical protein [Ruegeria sp. HKCCD6119]
MAKPRQGMQCLFDRSGKIYLFGNFRFPVAVVNEQIVASRRVETSKSQHVLKVISKFRRQPLAGMKALAVLKTFCKWLRTQACALNTLRAFA